MFRGWLWGELQQRLRSDSALLVQALVLALVHPWARVGGWSAWTLLGGLILLGVVLALRRRADGGLLWGAVGLHGGLVGGWFTLQAGILEVSAGAQAWLVGTGGHAPNPIGGLLGWVGLGIVLLALKRHW